MRAALWAHRQGRGPEFARAAFEREFARGEDISDVALLDEIARSVGLDGVREAIADPEVKRALKEATEAAWALGVQGVPTLEAGRRLYFGDDRLEEAAKRPDDRFAFATRRLRLTNTHKWVELPAITVSLGAVVEPASAPRCSSPCWRSSASPPPSIVVAARAGAGAGAAAADAGQPRLPDRRAQPRRLRAAARVRARPARAAARPRSSLVIFDVDHFKRLNDSYGHAAGDAALRSIGDIVAATMRRSDVFGRLGGEEFGLLLPDTGIAGAATVADKLRRRFAAPTAGQRPLTVSFGVARGPLRREHRARDVRRRRPRPLRGQARRARPRDALRRAAAPPPSGAASRRASARGRRGTRAPPPRRRARGRPRRRRGTAS